MIDSTAEVFLRVCAKRGVDFSRTVMLGRQQLDDLSYAETFFAGLGAKAVDSIDASTFEGATIIADLNRPLPRDLRRRFTAVIDSGTLEHVFDIATALRSCLDLLELGGHYIAIAPANNWPGHGFYQFSPELVFRTLSTESGFQLRAVFAVELRRNPRWYAISDPQALGIRAYWRNQVRTYLMAVARRVDLVDLSGFTPQQSDYVARWDGNEGGPGARIRSSGPEGRLKRLLWRSSPAAMKRGYAALQEARQEHFNPAIFTRVDVASLAEHIR